MNTTFEFENQNLLERTTKTQKKGVSKKFKLIAFINIVVIAYFAYGSLNKSLVQKNNEISPKLFKHMMATYTSDEMSHFHHKMRLLVHTGALDSLTQYQSVVKQAKEKCSETGKQITDAKNMSTSVEKLLTKLKNPVSAVKSLVPSAFSGLFNLRQVGDAKKHNFSFDIQSIISKISSAHTTQQNVSLLLIQDLTRLG